MYFFISPEDTSAMSFTRIADIVDQPEFSLYEINITVRRMLRQTIADAMLNMTELYKPDNLSVVENSNIEDKSSDEDLFKKIDEMAKATKDKFNSIPVESLIE
jgi:hypothetical protein